jgi:hypothetical protein
VDNVEKLRFPQSGRFTGSQRRTKSYQRYPKSSLMGRKRRDHRTNFYDPDPTRAGKFAIRVFQHNRQKADSGTAPLTNGLRRV